MTLQSPLGASRPLVKQVVAPRRVMRNVSGGQKTTGRTVLTAHISGSLAVLKSLRFRLRGGTEKLLHVNVLVFSNIAITSDLACFEVGLELQRFAERCQGEACEKEQSEHGRKDEETGKSAAVSEHFSVRLGSAVRTESTESEQNTFLRKIGRSRHDGRSGASVGLGSFRRGHASKIYRCLPRQICRMVRDLSSLAY